MKHLGKRGSLSLAQFKRLVPLNISGRPNEYPALAKQFAVVCVYGDDGDLTQCESLEEMREMYIASEMLHYRKITWYALPLTLIIHLQQQAENTFEKNGGTAMFATVVKTG